MPRQAKPRKLDEEKQPALFSVSDFPERPDLVVIIREKRHEHTGKILTKDEELCLRIVEDVINGLSQRAIARKYHISRNSIGQVVEFLDEQGKLEPLKKRVARKLGQIVEVCTDTALELLDAGKVPANVVPVMMGIASDKKALLDGDPTARVEEVQRKVITIDDLVEKQRLLRERIAARLPCGESNQLTAKIEPRMPSGEASQGTARLPETIDVESSVLKEKGQ